MKTNYSFKPQKDYSKSTLDKKLPNLTPYLIKSPTYTTSISSSPVIPKVESNKNHTPIIDYSMPKAMAYESKQSMKSTIELYESNILPRVQVYYMRK